MADYVESLAAEGIPHELLDVTEIRARWPQFTLPDGTTGLFQERGAIVPADRTVAVLQRRATAHGARLVDETPVTGLRDLGDDGVEAILRTNAFLGGHVFLESMAWSVSEYCRGERQDDMSAVLIEYLAPAEALPLPGR